MNVRWGLKLLLGGVVGIVGGAIYLDHGLNGGDPDGIFADGLVKGPFGLVVGVALLVFGFRALRPTRPFPGAGVTWVGDADEAPKG
jgi:hypothetical protein